MQKLSECELAVLIGQTVPSLRKTGNGYMGLCPLPDHKERTGSLHVYTGRDGEGRYHCFGCGADGDSIAWKREVLHQSWREASDGATAPDPTPEMLQRRRREGGLRALEARAVSFFESHEDFSVFHDPAELERRLPLRGRLLRHLQGPFSQPQPGGTK